MKIPLFREYPSLENQLPYRSIGRFPTPVNKLVEMGAEIGADQLYIKRDDLSGEIYGGNKVRKLEFLLGAALRDNIKEVITFGYAGSNHALATAIYAEKIGLKCATMLLPQINAHYVRRNLLASHHANAEIHYYRGTSTLTFGILGKFLKSLLAYRSFPRFIPPGGTCPAGIMGYVNAALELKAQIAAEELPEPDSIYVPLGSMGTSVGLILGIKAAKLKSRVIAVRVIESSAANARKMMQLLQASAAFIRKNDSTFPSLSFPESEINIREDCFGAGYARFTEKAMRAAQMMRNACGIVLNGTYSAKAFSAVIDDAKTGALKGKRILFWNTYNSRDLAALTSHADYHLLPKCLHPYFEEDVQPLDQMGFDR